MGRYVATALQNLLDLDACETQTTLDLYLTDTTEIHVATKELLDADTGLGFDHTADLRRANELRQSVLSPPNRVSVLIQNVDKVFGGIVVTEDLVKASGVIGRYYEDPAGVLPSAWVELYRGEVFVTEVSEQAVQIEILNELAAAGYCVGDWTLAETCQFMFKHAATCGYAGSETECNKKRKSKAGCRGRDNEHRFGGMEYPDIQTPSVVLGGGNPPPGHTNCPRLDQYVLVRCKACSRPHPKIVRRLKIYDELFNPVTNTFHGIDTLTVVENEPIWRIEAASGAVSFSSFSHKVLWYREHTNGEPVANFMTDEPVLTWLGGLADSTVKDSRYTGQMESVMRIEMIDGHIYAAGDEDDKFVVCHNAKDPPTD